VCASLPSRFSSFAPYSQQQQQWCIYVCERTKRSNKHKQAQQQQQQCCRNRISLTLISFLFVHISLPLLDHRLLESFVVLAVVVTHSGGLLWFCLTAVAAAFVFFFALTAVAVVVFFFFYSPFRSFNLITYFSFVEICLLDWIVLVCAQLQGPCPPFKKDGNTHTRLLSFLAIVQHLYFPSLLLLLSLSSSSSSSSSSSLSIYILTVPTSSPTTSIWYE